MKKILFTLIILLSGIPLFSQMPANLYSTDYKFFKIDTRQKADTVTNNYIIIDSNLAKLNLYSLSNTSEEQISNRERVFRKGDSLLLKFLNGKNLSLINRPAHPELELNDRSFIEFKFLGEFSSKFWIVSYWGGYNCTLGFKLINFHDGEEMNIKGYPICSSKDNKYFITGFVDECWGHYIELYKLIDSKYQLVTNIFFQDVTLIIDKVGWINNDIVLLKVNSIINKESSNKYILLKIN